MWYYHLRFWSIIFMTQHEQSRADRDDFISINWDNIIDGIDFCIFLVTIAAGIGIGINFSQTDWYQSKRQKQFNEKFKLMISW